MKINNFFISILFILFGSFSYAQKMNHEFGVFAGAISMQTDYGQRNHFPSSYANVGVGVGLSYYIGWDVEKIKWNDRITYIKNHMKFKAEFSYMSDSFIHRGKYANGHSDNSIKLAAMKGSTKIFNIGGQLEYSLFSFSDFRKWEPYISGGYFYVSFDPDMKTSLGDWRQNSSLLPDVYLNDGIFLEKDNTTAFVFGGGTKYRMNKKFAVVFDLKWQRFLSNKVDGLDPKIDANKYREWLFFFNVGAIFKLN